MIFFLKQTLPEIFEIDYTHIFYKEIKMFFTFGKNQIRSLLGIVWIFMWKILIDIHILRLEFPVRVSRYLNVMDKVATHLKKELFK